MPKQTKLIIAILGILILVGAVGIAVWKSLHGPVPTSHQVSKEKKLPLPPRDTLPLLSDELFMNPDQYFDKPVMVYGKVDELSRNCTDVVCSENQPCCQGCGAEVGFRRPQTKIATTIGTNIPFYGTYQGKTIGCTGNNCSVSCYPFKSGREYVMRVVLMKNKFGQSFMELEEIIELESSLDSAGIHPICGNGVCEEGEKDCSQDCLIEEILTLFPELPLQPMRKTEYTEFFEYDQANNPRQRTLTGSEIVVSFAGDRPDFFVLSEMRLPDLGWKQDITVSADGPTGGRWGYVKDGKHIIFHENILYDARWITVFVEE